MIKRIIRKIYENIITYFYTEDLEDETAYVSNDEEVIVYLDKSINLIKIRVNDIIYMIPLDSNNNFLTFNSENTNKTDLNDATIEQLHIMLETYEDLEDYDKCMEIRDIINKRSNKNNE